MPKKNKMIYKQCVIQKDTTKTTTWIPEKYAHKGKILKLKDNGVWEDGWAVVSVGSALDEKYLSDSHKDIKLHRKRTGDSLPKCPKK